jgi:hypothetical protein
LKPEKRSVDYEISAQHCTSCQYLTWAMSSPLLISFPGRRNSFFHTKRALISTGRPQPHDPSNPSIYPHKIRKISLIFLFLSVLGVQVFPISTVHRPHPSRNYLCTSTRQSPFFISSLSLFSPPRLHLSLLANKLQEHHRWSAAAH